MKKLIFKKASKKRKNMKQFEKSSTFTRLSGYFSSYANQLQIYKNDTITPKEKRFIENMRMKSSYSR
jgi:hypothetical protein